MYTPIIFFLLLCKTVYSIPTDSSSLVVSTTEPAKEKPAEFSNDLQVSPQIYSMQIIANVSNRFARTLITSRVRNLKKQAQQTTFSVILPENAFISEFEMEIDEKVYKAYVKEKGEAKKIYEQAVMSGQSAAHVELSARDSKTFTVSVNIEPESKTIFRLLYEELLERQVGQYELVINIHPGQIVKDLGVQVNIDESRPLTFVKTPSLRTGNEISKNDDKLDPSANIYFTDKYSAVVQFNPDINRQKQFAENLGGNTENGLAGQFVVQYDVERDPQGGEVLVKDGYFVHFFAPSELEPLPKHIVFVLDHSGSMSGRKLDQLIEAMQNILSELNAKDLFNIVRFYDDASVWDPVENKFKTVELSSPKYGELEPFLREANLPQPAEATEENIKKAKDIVTDKSLLGNTNIIAGLEVGVFLTKRTQENKSKKYEPMIIFLTDGLPNVGIGSTDEITNIVTKLNTGEKRAAIFSLSFGLGAEKTFLKKLSSKNLGFSRHIYEAADASLQLQDFYRLISSPLMSNITFKYVDGASEVTKTHYPILFKGSEIVVAGRTGSNVDFLPRVIGICTIGPVIFNTTRTEPVTSLERLWAYLTVSQMLTQRETAENKTELTKKALDLALKYSFVTDVTSLVVVKPNQTDSVDAEVVAPTPASIAGGAQFSSGQHVLFDYAHPIALSEPIAPPPAFYPSTTTVLSTYATTEQPSIPQWLQDLKNHNESITTPQGSFKLGRGGDVTIRPNCPKTPNNSTGVCTIIYDCPQVFSLLTDVNIYLQYFCPLNEYAGVCCPV
ncbi:inter-alpha-trypsin inhibitor heavy chain H4-like [Zophobas morio]